MKKGLAFLLAAVMAISINCWIAVSAEELTVEEKVDFKTIGKIYDGEKLELKDDAWNIGFSNLGLIDSSDKKEGSGSYSYTADGAKDLSVWFTGAQVTSGQIDVTAADQPALSMWLYASDKTKIQNNVINIFVKGAGAINPAQSVSYYVDTTTMENGWNHIILPIEKNDPGVEQMTCDGIKFGYTYKEVALNKLNVFQVSFSSSAAMTMKFDDFKIVDLNETQTIKRTDNDFKKVGMIYDGDQFENADGKWNTGFWGVTGRVNTTDQKQGDGCYEYYVNGTVGVVGDYNMFFIGENQTRQDYPIDISEIGNPALSFWFWIEDASKLEGDMEIHLSQQTDSIPAVLTNGRTIWLHNSSFKSGWNKFVIPLYKTNPGATPPEYTFGNANFGYSHSDENELRSFFFKYGVPGNTVVRFDDIKIVDMDDLEGGKPMITVDIVKGTGQETSSDPVSSVTDNNSSDTGSDSDSDSQTPDTSENNIWFIMILFASAGLFMVKTVLTAKKSTNS